jgi:amino acid adenylation domain-containing protein
VPPGSSVADLQRAICRQLSVWAECENTFADFVRKMAPVRAGMLIEHYRAGSLFSAQVAVSEVQAPRKAGQIEFRPGTVWETVPGAGPCIHVELGDRQFKVSLSGVGDELFGRDAACVLDLLAESLSLASTGADIERALPSSPGSPSSPDQQGSASTAATSAQGERLDWLFDRARMHDPEAVAIQADEGSLTYRELNARAERLAAHLQSRGVGRESIVGVSLERTSGLIVALLAILKAGGAYLPLDTSLPNERIKAIVRDSGLAHVITQSQDRARFAALGVAQCHLALSEDIGDATVADCGAQPGDIAYVIYTSGSTGAPKGVVIEHRSSANMALETAAAYGLTRSDRVLQFASVSWDTHTEEIWACFAAGGTLILRTPEMLASFEGFASACAKRGVTVANLPTVFWMELVRSRVRLDDSFRLVIVGGEAVSQQVVSEWHALMGRRIRLVNTYGLTEAAAVSLWCDLDSEDGRTQQGIAPLGRPLANVRVHLLGNDGGILNGAAEGEIAIGGIGVARGYIGSPKHASECFVPEPGAGDARMYRTGDMARRREDGVFEFIGRADNQVKIRGFRVELEDVEAALLLHPRVTASAAISYVGSNGHSRIDAVVAADGEAGAIDEEIRATVARHLPRFMVPSRVVVLQRLPKTTSGKVDRSKLAEYCLSGQIATTEPVAAGGNMSTEEAVLVSVWQDVLGVEAVERCSDFFACGGDSISSILVVSELTARGWRVGADQILQNPLLEDAARFLVRAESGASSVGEHVGPGDAMDSDSGVILPVTPMQSGVLFEVMSAEGVPLYVDQDLWLLRGSVDYSAFADAWSDVFARHSALRASFEWPDGVPVQRINPNVPLPLDVVDWGDLSQSEQEVALGQIVRRDLATPLKLDCPPLCRFLLIRLDDEHHWLLWSIHRLIIDGWSTTIALDDFLAFYQARTLSADPPAIAPDSYRSYVRSMVNRDVSADREFWEGYLDGIEAPTPLPKKGVTEATTRVARHETIRGSLDRRLRSALDELCRSEGVTLGAVARAAWGLLLARCSGEDRAVFGATTAGRPASMRQIADLVGCCINTLPFRVDVNGAHTVRELLATVQRASAQWLEHQTTPLGRVQDWCGVDPRLPLFESILILQNYPGGEAFDRHGALRLLHARSYEQIHYPLTVVFCARDTVTLEITYDPTLFEATAVSGLFRGLESILAEFARHPEAPLDAVELCPPAEKDRLLRWLDSLRRDYPQDQVTHDLVDMQVRRRPDAIALRGAQGACSYRRMSSWTAALANAIAADAEPGSFVVLFLGRSMECVVAMLAVLSVGAAYVPVDPDTPDERVAFMLRDCRPSVIVTTGSLRGRVQGLGYSVVEVRLERADSDHIEGLPARRRVDLDDPAYAIYTSGSTGTPKAVVISHRALVNYVHALVDAWCVAEDDVTLQFTSPSYDFAVGDIYASLASGGVVLIQDTETMASSTGFWRNCSKHGVTILNLPTSYWAEVARDIMSGRIELPRSIRLVDVGGEAASAVDVHQWVGCFASRVTLINGYGPTETTVEATHCRLATIATGSEANAPVPIGKPLANYRTYITSPDRSLLKLMPQGLPGELCIGGPGVAHGYLGRPELSKDCFCPDPFTDGGGARLYRTGDVALMREDDTLVYLGRLDSQIKVRGFRVELEEVEAVLRDQPGVADAGVRVQAGKRLVGFIEAADGVNPDIDLVLSGIRSRLPVHMVPDDIIATDAIPRFGNGKINRRALPEIPVGTRDRGQFVAPTTPTQCILAEIWREILELDVVGIHDNFFELGGNSILALRLMSQAGVRGLRLSPRDVFENATVAALAHALEAGA